MEEKQNTRWQKFMSQYDDMPKSLRKGKYGFVISMMALGIISWLVFYVYVNIESILMAFQEFKGYDENYQEIYEWSFYNFRHFWEEMTYGGWAAASFRDALINTLLFFVVGNAFVIPLTYLISYYLYKRGTGTEGFTWMLYLPGIISSVVLVTIFKNIVEVNGLLSAVSLKMGGEAITGLLTTEECAKWTVMAYNTWVGFPGSYILVTAAMRRIPEEIIESAQLDGIGLWKELWHIIFPLIWPTMQILMIQKVAGLLSADGPILLLTGGDHDTYTIGFWFYQQIIVSHSYEYPSAIGLIMTIFMAPIVLTVKYATDKINQDAAV